LYKERAHALYRTSLMSVDFPEPDTPVTQVKVLEVVLAGALDHELISASPAAGRGYLDRQLAGEVAAGEGTFRRDDLGGRPLGDDLAAVDPCSGA
jgi:hypothetical protein